MILKFTFTGADDGTDVQQMVEIQKEFPFVEWGILTSQNVGRPRFPSYDWINQLPGKGLNLSLHLCGRLVRDFVKGDTKELDSVLPVFSFTNAFKRAQLNFHGFKHDMDLGPFLHLLGVYKDKEFIFQFDGRNEPIFEIVRRHAHNISALFDKSGGAGVLPESWPAPRIADFCGYAGGLSPENLREQMTIIDNLVQHRETWIDIETHVRSDNDRLFDMAKVIKCCEIFRNFNQEKQ